MDVGQVNPQPTPRYTPLFIPRSIFRALTRTFIWVRFLKDVYEKFLVFCNSILEKLCYGVLHVEENLGDEFCGELS